MNPLCTAEGRGTAIPRIIAPGPTTRPAPGPGRLDPTPPRSPLRRKARGELQSSAMDFQLTEQQELIRKEVATLARSFSLDYWLEKDRKAEYPTDWIRAFAQA